MPAASSFFFFLCTVPVKPQSSREVKGVEKQQGMLRLPVYPLECFRQYCPRHVYYLYTMLLSFRSFQGKKKKILECGGRPPRVNFVFVQLRFLILSALTLSIEFTIDFATIILSRTACRLVFGHSPYGHIVLKETFTHHLSFFVLFCYRG